MEAALQEAQVLSLKCHELLLQIESGNASAQLQDQITQEAGRLGTLVHSMGGLLEREPASRRDILQRKMQSATQNYQSLRRTIDSHMDKEHRKRLEERERQELFGDRPDVVINMNSTPLLRERDGLRRSTRRMDEIGSVGASVLQSLSEQRELLQGTRRKVNDIFDVLGLSNSILRIADRKNYVDGWIVAGGVVLTLFVLWYVWYFYRV